MKLSIPIVVVLASLIASPSFADSCDASSSPPSYSTGGTKSMSCDLHTGLRVTPTDGAGNTTGTASNPTYVQGTVTPSGTGDVNLKQVGGATTATGHGTASGAIRVELPTDGTGKVNVQGLGTAGTQSGGVLTIQGDPAGTAVPVSGTVTSSPGTGITPTDRTITSASGSSQTLMALNASRHSLTVMNSGNANCGVNPTGGTAAIGGAGTLTLYPGGSYSPRIPSLSAVTVICTAGQPVYANEN